MPDKSREYDVVLGAKQVQPPIHDVMLANGAVLGGIEGVSKRLASTDAQIRLAALTDIWQYGERGINLIISALHDSDEVVQQAAYKLLVMKADNLQVLKALWGYKPKHIQAIKTKCLPSNSYQLGDLTFMCMNLDKQQLFTGYSQGTVKIWNWATTQESERLKAWNHELVKNNYDKYPEYIKEINSYPGFKSPVTSIHWNGNEQIFVSGCQGKTIHVRDLQTGRTIYHWNFKRHHKDISAIAFTSDGQTLISGLDFADRTVKIWNLRNGMVVCTLNKYLSGNPILFSPDGSLLIINCDDNKVRVYNWQTQEDIFTLKAEKHIVSAAFSSDSNLLASANKNSLKLWDIRAGTAICELGNFRGVGAKITISPDGSFVLSARQSEIDLWSF